MILSRALLLFALLASCRGLHAGETAKSPPVAKPNIVLILADDMGYSDLGCFGSEIPTPNLDALAAGGLRFTQFYNSARCSPTRAALMTGLHPHQAGVGRLAHESKRPAPGNRFAGYLGHLNDRCVTLAEALRPAGYHTYMAGKWHLGAGQPEQWPLQRGFERFYGILSGVDSYLRPRGLTLDNESLPPPTDPEYYTTDAFTDFAIKAVGEQKDAAPFFLYLAFNAPHWPLQARSADIAKFAGKYREGWDKARGARHAKQLALGILSPDWPQSERDEHARAWEALTEEQKTALDYRMAVYAAQVHRMDWNIGRLVAALRERGQLDNTLVVFLSDNGACAEPYTDLGGQPQSRINDPAASNNVSYGTGWANLSNTPFRKFKSFLHEGGIATPLVVHWPQGLKTAPGAMDHTPGYLTDIMATFVEVGGATYPKTVAGRRITPIAGVSLVPRFSAAAAPPAAPRALFWEQYGYKAVRYGELKAVFSPKDSYDRSGRGEWELYDLSTDRTELHDLAASRPGELNELVARWDAWAARSQVYPDPGYDINGTAGSALVIAGKMTVAQATAAYGLVPGTTKTENLPIRDPFILADQPSRTYYLYRSMARPRDDGAGAKGVEVFSSPDLINWSGPTPVFSVPHEFWARSLVWAPEVHAYRGKYYLFTTFTAERSPAGQSAGNAAPQTRRGSQILVADSPLGPFKPFANQAHTPPSWMALDGTLWVEDGVPWMIFCHEWLQIKNGTMELMPLKDDLSAPAGPSRTLFDAKSAPWVKNYKDAGGNQDGYITDGPFLHRTQTGKLLMIWSSFGAERYAIGLAVSETGKVAGPWRHLPQTLVGANGGHGMLFRRFDGKLMLVFHQPNSPGGAERAKFFPVDDSGDTLRIADQDIR